MVRLFLWKGVGLEQDWGLNWGLRAHGWETMSCGPSPLYFIIFNQLFTCKPSIVCSIQRSYMCSSHFVLTPHTLPRASCPSLAQSLPSTVLLCSHEFSYSSPIPRFSFSFTQISHFTFKDLKKKAILKYFNKYLIIY